MKDDARALDAAYFGGIENGARTVVRATTYHEENKDDDDERSLLHLTARDRRKAAKMLGKGVCAEGGEEREWRRELQVMLMMNYKTEIQILSGRMGGLEEWLERKLAVVTTKV